MQDFEYQLTGKLTPDCKGLELDFASDIVRVLYQIKDIPLDITIKKFHRQRSLAQNAWMWGICIPTIRAFMKECNGSCPSAEGVYAYLRINIVGQEVIIEEIDGHDIPVVSGKRFSQMTTIEFSEAVEKIVLHYAEQGLEIPLPQPKTNNFLGDIVHKQLTDE